MSEEKAPILKLIVIIIDKNRLSHANEVLQEELVRHQYVCHGKGTANSELLDVLGIGSSDKGIVLCLQPQFRIPELLKAITEKLKLSQRGRGIAFTIPLSGVSNPMTHILSEEKLAKLAEDLEPEKREHLMSLFKRQTEREWDNMETEKSVAQHDLIVSVVNRGYSDELMDKAKEVGATGGTIIQTRRIGVEDTVKFFGISVQTEKEIVAILTGRQSKNAIMRTINQYFGLSSDARGIVFSLPVDCVAGPDIMNS